MKLTKLTAPVAAILRLLNLIDMRLVSFLLVVSLVACIGENISTKPKRRSPDERLAFALNAKSNRQRESESRENIRPVVIFFHDVTDILRERNLSKAQKSRLVAAALKEFEKLSSFDQAWTGEHAETGEEYLKAMFASLGDGSLSELLQREDFRKVRTMLIWTEVIDSKYPKTLSLLSKERRVDFPLFSGYGYEVPAQWQSKRVQQ